MTHPFHPVSSGIRADWRALWNTKWHGRLGQGAWFAVPSVALALLAHLASVAPCPGPLLTAAALLGLTGLAAGVSAARSRPTARSRLSGIRNRPARFGGPAEYLVALVTQAGLHGLFVLSAPPRAARPALLERMLCHPPAAGDRALEQLGNPGADLAAGAVRALPRSMQSSGWAPEARGLLVLAAHTVAAAGALWWLRRGTATVRAAVRLLASRLTPLAASSEVLRPTRRSVPVTRQQPPWLRTVSLRYTLVRRGPPGRPTPAAVAVF
ncbi:hypothetical protein [Frankia sp. Cppng1_Ct_nod]|uniref:hypothetical protein n=1 Tax=Frankia sp. Cppng1_Ct_nod TaxID=2897162 RepID=UPI0020255F5A|nr:hypothetical protein [Frankia sp. Cppng1_Ct_nod]